MMVAKSPGLYIAAAALWLVAVWVSVPSMLPPSFFADKHDSLFHYCALTLLAYFWFYSAYHVCSFLAYSRRRPNKQETSDTADFTEAVPSVAVLYTVCNDFMKEAALKNLNLDYPNCHLFICDDSTDPSTKAEIAQFHLEHLGRCTLFRRNGREGYKAGNLNNALKHIGTRYRYIVLADSDSQISPDFVRLALRYFRTDEKLAFVQAPHAANFRQGTRGFPAELALGVETLWRFLSLKDRYGITPMVGHGTMIRVQTLKEVGGFPERVSEDLCLTAILRRNGCRVGGGWA